MTDTDAVDGLQADDSGSSSAIIAGVCGISVFGCLDDDWPNDSILRPCIRLGPK